VTLAEAADALAVSQRTARRYISEGHLEAVRLGSKTIRVKADSVERFANAAPIGVPR
jgi:excisionase family DNA binding protein